MQTESIFYEVSEIKKYSQLSESELISMALLKGMKQLYFEELTKLFLEDKISENYFINKVGYDYFETIKQQKEAIDSDFNWALN